MIYDMTERVQEAWVYFDKLLDERIAKISEISEVPIDHFVKINPVEFCEKNKRQVIQNYEYKNIRDFINEKKTADDIYLISPEDAIEETAAQVSYKSGTEIRRTLRASKCEVVPCPLDLAQDFFIRNHRQKPPLVRNSTAVSFALVYKEECVAVMLYDVSNGAIRGQKKDYELVRLSISKGTRIHGGASKLQKACEKTLWEMGERSIYSYSNATINSGAVYSKLGFKTSKVEGGQPFVLLRNNKLERLINLYPNSTDRILAQNGWLKTHIGGNRLWVKDIEEPQEEK